MRIRKLTAAVEKELLARREQHNSGARVAARIVDDVRLRGDAALFAWCRKLDGVTLTPTSVWLSKKELSAAEKHVSPDLRRAIRLAMDDVRRVADRQLPRAWSVSTQPGVTISQLVRPIESVGCYIPGGRFALLSTLVMTAAPAKVAGVERIVAVCPKPNSGLLATAAILGISEVARIGGAQAIAALAYGTDTIPRVEKICGPGNKYVTAAKQTVSSDCAIDLPAGPTEAIVLAEHGNPRWIAADLLAQAEHAPDAAALLVTTSPSLAREVQGEIRRQIKDLPGSPAQVSTKAAGAILVARSLDQACHFVNRFAPEHLSLPDRPDRLLAKIRAAGTIFLGPWGAQPLGDYASGSNHVLPTGGWARMRGGLSAADFVKCITVQKIMRHGFERLADAVETLAAAEGLAAHRYAVRVRR